MGFVFLDGNLSLGVMNDVEGGNLSAFALEGLGVMPFLLDVMVPVSFEFCRNQSVAVVMVLLFSRCCKGSVAHRKQTKSNSNNDGCENTISVHLCLQSINCDLNPERLMDAPESDGVGPESSSTLLAAWLGLAIPRRTRKNVRGKLRKSDGAP
jgi:hypothetical protein